MSKAATAAARSDQQGAIFPHCLRCHKPVDKLIITPHASNPHKVVVEFFCHGETVEQEMSSTLLAKEVGLGSYTVFNEYTSGMMKGTAR
jgi:hypothetical protein